MVSPPAVAVSSRIYVEGRETSSERKLVFGIVLLCLVSADAALAREMGVVNAPIGEATPSVEARTFPTKAVQGTVGRPSFAVATPRPDVGQAEANP